MAKEISVRVRKAKMDVGLMAQGSSPGGGDGKQKSDGAEGRTVENRRVRQELDHVVQELQDACAAQSSCPE